MKEGRLVVLICWYFHRLSKQNCKTIHIHGSLLFPSSINFSVISIQKIAVYCCRLWMVRIGVLPIDSVFRKATKPSTCTVHKWNLVNHLWTLVAGWLGHVGWAADNSAGYCSSDDVLREDLTHFEDALCQREKYCPCIYLQDSDESTWI